MTQKIEFDPVRAKPYRKVTEVLAFPSKSAMAFSKAWGDEKLRPGSWVIIPLNSDRTNSEDIYGCDGEVFEQTYERSPSQRPHHYRKKGTILAYQPGHSFTVDTRLGDGHLETEAAVGETHESWLVQGPGGELYPLEHETFLETYQFADITSGEYRVKTAAEHWKADGSPKRILALDGGGVRGILTLGYLQKIEDLLKERHGGAESFRLSHYFDLIAGTSTGAIIAACLAKGMSVQEIRKLYMQLGETVFRRSFFRRGILRAKFSERQLKKELTKVFQSNTMGSGAIETGLLVVAKRLDTGSTWPMSNNPDGQFYRARHGDSFFSNEDYLVRKVVRASTAAPHYFAPEKIEISPEAERPHGQFVDGGVSPHNNPSLIALQNVGLAGFGVGWKFELDKLMLVSVGTGSREPGVSKSWFAGAHAFKSLASLMDDCGEAVETSLQWMSESPTARRLDAAIGTMEGDLIAERPLLHYVRYNVQLEPEWLAEHLRLKGITAKEARQLQKMDEPKNMKRLGELGEQGAEAQLEPSHFPAHFDL